MYFPNARCEGDTSHTNLPAMAKVDLQLAEELGTDLLPVAVS